MNKKKESREMKKKRMKDDRKHRDVERILKHSREKKRTGRRQKEKR